MFTPFGYVITEDGTIYSLTQKWCHGVVLSLLFPDLEKDNGYELPDEDFDVFEYQRFELDHSRETTAIRISFSLTNGALNISKGEDAKANPEQIEAITKILKVQGLSLSDKIENDYRQTTARTLLKQLRAGEI